MGPIVNAAAAHRKEIKCSTDWWQLLHASIKTRLIFIVGQASKVTRRKWSTTHTKWNIYVTPCHPLFSFWVKHIHMYICECVCVQCTYLPYITHTLRFVVCTCFCLLSLCFAFNPFQTKMLRFDFIFVRFCFVFIFLLHTLLLTSRPAAVFPWLRSLHIKYIICIYYIHIFNILASKISYYPHAVCVCEWVRAAFICACKFYLFFTSA